MPRSNEIEKKWLQLYEKQLFELSETLPEKSNISFLL
jgi:hypothetical protein